ETATLPGGRLREPPDVLIAADAVLSTDAVEIAGDWPAVFKVRRRLDAPRTECGALEACPVAACAGIAEPDRFFEELRSAGWTLTAAERFRDHHRYSARDLARLVSLARDSGARALVTTEKDYVRLLPFRPFSLPVAWVPLTMEPDPMPPFRDWLAAQLRAARDEVPTAGV
ncbi:MAG TPA: tetraacyldisaccharide 4'-kinase, partial [Vicinamibacterales bacterium]|nr:tetraacyldisaccharide 4'-kinase [Vicinamibacterales bacterium]